MKLPLFAGCALACLALSGCLGAGGAGSAQLTDAFKTIASDPNCGHVDRIQGDLGGLSGGLHVFLERTCPAHTAAPPGDPSQVPKP